MAELNVVPIYETNFREISDMLRQTADECETEPQDGSVPRTQAIVAVRYLEDGTSVTYGWGKSID